MAWKPTEITDLSGTTAIVTGANSGIGFVEARTLADHGAHVILAVRSLDAGRAAAARIDGSTAVEALDLASQESVREFAARIDRPVDLLVNNAGVMAPPTRRTTVDGFELQFGTNHLGHFALTGLLLPALLAAPSSRVTTVASLAHHQGDDRVVNGNPPQDYDPRTSYGRSKLANLLFALELHRRATAAGSPLTSTAAHPGVAVTNLVASRDGMGARWVVRTFAPPLMRLVLPGSEGGAEAVLYAATVAAPGSYSGPQGPGEVRGKVGPAKLSPLAGDPDLARRLWTRSQELTGVAFDL
ncbi:NADP-dependent 3-hydroxy acid dehydrogenase YdfG [Humibacillus xanthopallidus]|uniref:NADP-dependent 3-hydroxy acid dehydrogenase YdfG n=1 Tax=Humibacillus xanthopallidus TaxID=412689 RepID=A0A543PKN7_9MICO|nr:oxidoreductase [Humibacillus xanthopallidus]TQN44642.1 NADP-dependent 3-hydroxy acid dehydrogenase YdfG [Humibacillus xanthopallidus]